MMEISKQGNPKRFTLRDSCRWRCEWRRERSVHVPIEGVAFQILALEIFLDEMFSYAPT